MAETATTLPGAALSQKFTNFNILQAAYKVVDGHEIRADLIIPKSLATASKAPVIARFHGGGLVSHLIAHKVCPTRRIFTERNSRCEETPFTQTGFPNGSLM